MTTTYTHKGLDAVELVTSGGTTATVTLHGAHVCSFKPSKKEEVIFVSEQAVYKPPKAIRGGVPVCWPQFNDMGPGPAHGFARNSPFTVERQSDTAVVMLLRASEATREHFAHEFELRVTVAVSDDEGGQLLQTVHVTNKGGEEMRTTAALHAYFRVSDIANVEVRGLEGVDFFDNLNDRQKAAGGSEALTVAQNVDRLYAHAGERDRIAVRDAGPLQRSIVVGTAAFQDTVVWNPWADKAAAFADMADAEFRQMICVEPASAACFLDGGAVVVPAGGVWEASQRIHVEALS